MLKLIISSILCILSSMFGYYTYKHKKDMVLLYKRWALFNDLALREITFNKTPINKIIDIFSKEKTLFDKLISIYLEKLKSNEKIEFLNTEIKSLSLDKNTITLINEYFNNLGSIDYQSQINNLKNFQKILEDILNQKTKDLKTNGNLALKLGLIFGIAIMVLMI